MAVRRQPGGWGRVGSGRKSDLRGMIQRPEEGRPWRKSPSDCQVMFRPTKQTTHLVYNGNLSVDDFALERFHDYRRIGAFELCRSVRRHNFSFADRRYLHDRNDISVIRIRYTMKKGRTTHPCLPLHVPSTSSYSFCLRKSSSCAPKYDGWSVIVCVNSRCISKRRARNISKPINGGQRVTVACEGIKQNDKVKRGTWCQRNDRSFAICIDTNEEEHPCAVRHPLIASGRLPVLPLSPSQVLFLDTTSAGPVYLCPFILARFARRCSLRSGGG